MKVDNRVRRVVISFAAIAAMTVSLLAQAPAAPAPQGGAAPEGAGQGPAGQGRGGRGGRGGGRGMAQGGSGPLKVLFVSKGHPFDREGLFATLDTMGSDITWTHVEQPAAEMFLEPKMAAPYDVLLFYDMDGNQPDRRHSVAQPDGTNKITWDPPPADVQKNFKALLQSGKGLVFFHHAIASWVHSWPEYVEVMGGACDWGQPITIRGVEHPRSGFFQRTKQHVTVVDKAHPIVQGLGEAFDIEDESYSCPMFEDSVHPLLRTDFTPADHDRNLNPKTPFSNLAGWVKTAENSPVVYIQHGHDRTAWENPQFRMLMLNAMKWAGSLEAKAWAKANPKKIFK